MKQCKSGCPITHEHICCFYCPDREECKERCQEEDNSYCEDLVEVNETGLTVDQEKQIATMKLIATVVNQKKQLEEREKTLKEKLKESMEKYGIKSFDNDMLKVTYIAATTQNKFDSAKFKKEHPDICKQYEKSVSVSSYIKVEVK